MVLRSSVAWFKTREAQKKTAATFNDEEFLWEKWQMLCRMNKPLPLCVCVMGSVRRIVCLEWFSV